MGAPMLKPLRPTSVVAFLASVAIVYLLFRSHSLLNTSRLTTDSAAYLGYLAAHSFIQKANHSCAVGEPANNAIACSNKHFFPPPPARQVVPTTLVSHTPGWTIFTNLYFSNGTFYIVSDEGGLGGKYWPERRLLTSFGGFLEEEITELREPSEKEMDLITTAQAEQMWGEQVFDIQGLSILANDPKNNYMRHYYHVAAELFLGTERMFTNFDPMPGPTGSTFVPSPERIIFLNTDEEGFSDFPGLDKFYMHAQWPHITPLYEPSWREMASLAASGRRAWRFPAALFIDRTAAWRERWAQWTSRSVAGTWAIGSGEYGTGGVGRNQFWYEAARRRVLSFVGVSKDILDIGLRAMDPPLAPPRTDGEKDTFQITYINRQWSTSRRLLDHDHRRLVRALYAMCERNGWKFEAMLAEVMSKEEQMEVAAQTTVFVAVHGNGLTHMLLQPPHPRSAVVEIFHPPGFARDYEYTAGILGHRYYLVHNDTVYTPPDLPQNQYPQEIQGKEIPVQADVVVETIERHLLGPVVGPGHWKSWGGKEIGY